MTEERFWLLASLKLSAEASPEELAELEQHLRENPELQWQLNLFEATWQSKPSSRDRAEFAFNKHMQRLSNHFSGTVLQFDNPTQAEEPETITRRPRRLYRSIAWVSGIAAMLVAGWFAYVSLFQPSRESGNVAQNTVSTKRGSKSKVQLPDGTQVWLNADSRITYNENFQGKLREVNLSGEAFFDVVRNEERPFIIHTNYIDVKVLGTTFNVRSYADEKNTETSLIHGSVEITLRNHPEKKFTLKPNDKLIVNNDQAAPVKNGETEKSTSKEIVLTWGKVNYRQKTDSIATEILWTKNKLAFDKESLENIARMIERWYDVKVNITDETLRKKEYSISVEDESLQQVMEALREAGGKLRYTINNKEVTIRPA